MLLQQLNATRRKRLLASVALVAFGGLLIVVSARPSLAEQLRISDYSKAMFGAFATGSSSSSVSVTVVNTITDEELDLGSPLGQIILTAPMDFWER